ncbi:MAG: hypothetical protein LGB07_03070 [Sulfurovum sp.]|nr:hypothetical protein [Sulfurovum sp.]MCB4744621.1 hypothetical protein [Sulfurovum sp.]MCB4746209.1 hypothetical protein [Sulfurovum sp.]MCB4749390.1 hypothetical protein [Sulfurovum sp.]MCB4751987.1 hypothetical protein [Sulfurovum sp.]
MAYSIKQLWLWALLCSGVLFAQPLHMTPKQAEHIAKKVWLNEGAGKDKYLIWWNKGEDFASLGIGHFIWFPQGHTERFREVFPMVIAFMKKRGIQMPKWLNPKANFPWQTSKKFFIAKKTKTKKYMELFYFLRRTKSVQAEFMADRMVGALPQILDTIDDPKRAAEVQRHFNHILYKKEGSVDAQGLYILIDYTNFKGEGTLKSERYHGKGWGLLQVLEHMDMNHPNKYKAFADSAKSILEKRIKNAPQNRGEVRWREGWFKRLDTYWKQ